MAETLLRDLIDIPTSVHSGDYVLVLSEGVGKSDTVSSYVVTPQIAEVFDQALDIVRAAVESGGSRAAYLDGSFGSGKSHFMAMLYQILAGNPKARGKKGLADVVHRHSAWLDNRTFCLVPTYMLNAVSLDAAILDGYVRYVKENHPGKPLPAVYMDDLLIQNARALRRSMGDDAFIAALPQPDSDDAWAFGWTPADLDRAMEAESGTSERQQLVGDLLATLLSGYTNAVTADTKAYVPLDEGLSIISRHAKNVLGYDAVVLLLDELVLWLSLNIGNGPFLASEVQKVAKLVEARTMDRPAPIVSFVPRQRDLRDLVSKDVFGSGTTSLFDLLKYHDGRFDRIKLADGNLPEIIGERLLSPKNDEAKRQIDEVFAKRTGTLSPDKRDALIDAQGGLADEKSFRLTYPFAPAFVHVMVDIAEALQRERSALKLMAQILADHRDEYTLGPLVPLGTIYDVLISGADRPFADKLRAEFEQARRFYLTELRPYLLSEHHLTEDQVPDLPSRHAFRADDLVVKTLLLAALVPNVPALRSLTASRLATLNHGSIVSMVPGGDRTRVVQLLRKLSQEFGQFRISGEDDPVVSLSIVGVDTGAMVDRQRPFVDDARRRSAVRELLWTQFGVQDTGQFTTTRPMPWRGTERVVELVFTNVRDVERAPAQEFQPANDDALRIVVDYPFDEGNFSPADDHARVDSLIEAGTRANTLVWLPSFFSTDTMAKLTDYIAIGDALGKETFAQLTASLSSEDRDRARALLDNQHRALESGLVEALRRAYGVGGTGAANGTLAEVSERQVVALLDGLDDLRPPMGAELGVALERLCTQLLDHVYRKHPNLDPDGAKTFVRTKDLDAVLGLVERASLAAGGRLEITKADARLLRRIAVPLQVGAVHEDSLFVLDRYWQEELERRAAREPELRAAVTDGELPVGALASWVEEMIPGLQPYLRNFVVAVYGLIANRAWTRAGKVQPQPHVDEIRGDMALRAVRLPSEAEFAVAHARAVGVFDVRTQAVRRPRVVASIAGAVRQAAAQQLSTVEQLRDELERRAETLGLHGVPVGAMRGVDAPRLRTARLLAALMEKLADTPNDTDLLEALARAALPEELAVAHAHLKSAPAVVRALHDTRWQVLDGLAAQPDGEGAEVLAKLRDAAQHEENAAPLARALAVAEKAAIGLLTQVIRPTGGGTPVGAATPTTTRAQPPREGGPSGVSADEPSDPRVPSTRTPTSRPVGVRQGSRRARAAQLNDALREITTQLRAAMDQHPNAEVQIDWHIVGDEGRP